VKGAVEACLPKVCLAAVSCHTSMGTICFKVVRFGVLGKFSRVLDMIVYEPTAFQRRVLCL